MFVVNLEFNNKNYAFIPNFWGLLEEKIQITLAHLSLQRGGIDAMCIMVGRPNEDSLGFISYRFDYVLHWLLAT